MQDTAGNDDVELKGQVLVRLEPALEIRLRRKERDTSRSVQDIMRAGALMELDRLDREAAVMDPDTVALVQRAKDLGLDLRDVLARELERLAGAGSALPD